MGRPPRQLEYSKRGDEEITGYEINAFSKPMPRKLPLESPRTTLAICERCQYIVIRRRDHGRVYGVVAYNHWMISKPLSIASGQRNKSFFSPLIQVCYVALSHQMDSDFALQNSLHTCCPRSQPSLTFRRRPTGT